MSGGHFRADLREQDREIWRLAVPAFLALVAEPLFLLGDAAVVGHLGTISLAGLGLAATVLQTVVGLCVFLAYGTTASVARHLGAGDRAGALAQGVDGLWLALGIGSVTTLATGLLAGPLVELFGAGAAVGAAGTTYLRLAALGITPLLLMLAAVGVLRGLQDTRTPLIVAVTGNALNLVLNVVLVHGAGPVPSFGIAGSAIGSVIAQVLSASALVAVVVRGARREQAPMHPDRVGIIRAARASVALVVRTLTLRGALLVTTYAVTLGVGGDQTVDLATHQLAMALWGFLAFVLDALAIAAQAMTGRALGAGDGAGALTLTRRMVRAGVLAGAVTGLLLASTSPVLGALFSDDAQVRERLVPVLLVAALTQPLAGVVFVLDGVLIGAGDGRYLAWAGLVVLVLHAPVVLLVGRHGGGLVGVWVVFCALFMGARGVALVSRARGGRWLVTGAGAGAGAGTRDRHPGRRR